MKRLIVAGGGVIGLTSAIAACDRGWQAVVVDGGVEGSAAWVAAGMLAPAAEAHFGEEELVRLLIAGAERWPSFAADVEERSGASIGFEPTGTLMVAKDASDRAELRRSIELQRSMGLAVEPLSGTQLRRLEPSLAPGLAGGASLLGDHRVSNRALLAALEAICDQLGVVRVGAQVVRVEARGGRASVVLEGGRCLDGDAAVVALGAWSDAAIETSASLPALRPVKGHILRLRSQRPPIDRCVRAMVRGRAVYLVPRGDGELVVGATAEERGFDTTVQVGQVFALLEDARQVLPEIDELELVEAACGLRPGSSSNAPIVTRVPEGPVVIATGHHRNGILLAPLTAELVVSALEGRDHPAAPLLSAAQRRP